MLYMIPLDNIGIYVGKEEDACEEDKGPIILKEEFLNSIRKLQWKKAVVCSQEL